MLNQNLINRLAELCGISSEYLDSEGLPVVIAVENKVPLLQAMGFDLSSNAAVEAAIEDKMNASWSQIIPVVVVLHRNKPFCIDLRLPEKQLPESFKVTVTLEDDEKRIFNCSISELTIVEKSNEKSSASHSGKVHLSLPLPEDLPLGYHTLSIDDIESTCSLIVAPETCYEPEALIAGDRIWGSGIQLYSVRSRDNWGMGDYGDLNAMVERLAENGADFLGLNPVHALYQNNPLHCSPYSPSSRTYGNVLYIRPELLQEFQECESAMRLFASDDFQSQLHAVRSQDYIDYAAVATLKYQVLETLYDFFCKVHLKQGTERAQAFEDYCRENGESLRQFATFDALYEHFRNKDPMSWGWPCWPEAYQSPDSKGVKNFIKNHESRIRYFEFLQWVASEQFAQAQVTAREKGMMIGVYRDLAVGVDRGGADTWSNRSLYCLDASTGAPPDTLGPQGQNWGLPPFNPLILQKQRYEPFIRMIRNNMRDCGALRIDHAMGLFRLWWCPNNKSAAYGAYIHYPLQDLLGIIKLESQRLNCLVIGEDLGTVPNEIEQALPPARLYSSINGIHVQEGDRYPMPSEYKVRAMANLTCHDTPPLKGWWEEKDIDVASNLGIFDDERTNQERLNREHTRKAVISTLAMVNELPHGMNPYPHSTPPFSRELMERFTYYLALSNPQLTNVQLEDCMLIDTAVNVPGTSNEYPNWRRRLTENLDEFFDRQDNRRFFHNILQCRRA